MAGTFDEFLQEMEAAGKTATAKPEEPVVAPAPVVVAAPPPAAPKRKKAARPPGPPVTAPAATVQPEPQKVPASVEDFGTPPEVLRELDYKKFYDTTGQPTYGMALKEASRTQGVSAKALEEAAQKQGVNLQEIYNARKKGRSFDEIAKANRERGVLGFLPVEERDAAFKQTMKKVDDAQKGIASDEVDLRAAAKSTSYALAGTHEALPEVTKPGEHGYETAQLLVEALKKDPEQSRIYDLYGRSVSTGATNKYIEERAEQLRKRAGLTAGSPDALEKAAKYRRQATNEVLAYKTIGQWTPAVILQDVEITEGRKAPSVIGGLMPNIELIGVNNKGQAIFRQESGLGVLLRAIDLPQAAFTGWLEDEGVGRGIQTGANLMEYAMDHTEGSSPWVRYPAIAAGTVASIAFPDVFMAAGPAGKAVKAGLAEIKIAKNAPKVLDLLETAAKARAASDFVAATRAESEIRELLPIAADSLDQYDNATARIAVIKDPKQDILNDDIAELIAANVPTVEAAEFAASRSWLHPSVRRETTAVKRATKTVEKVGYDEAYDTRRLLDRVRNVRQSYLDSAPKTMEEYARFRAKGITKDLLTALPDTFVERIKQGGLPDLSAGDIDEIARLVEGVAPEALTDMKKFRTSVDAALKAHKKFGTDAYEAYRTFLREPGRHSLMSRMERRVKDAAGKTIAELQAPDLELIDRAQKAIEKNNELRGLAAALLREKIAADRKIVVQPLSLFDDVAPVGSDGKPLRLSPGGHRFLAQLREVYPDADIKDLYNATAMLDAKILAEAKRLKRDPYLVWAESASVGKATPQEEVTFGGKLGAPTPAAPPPAAPLAPPISAAQRAAEADRAEAESINAYYAARAAAAAAEAAARPPVLAALAWKPTLPAGTPVRDIAELADAKKLIQAALKGELPDGAALATFNGPDGAVASTVAVGDVRITWGSSKKTGQFGAQYRVGGNSGIIEGKATAEEALKAAQSKAYAQMSARAKRGEPALRNAPDFEALKPAATAPAPTPSVAPKAPAAAAPSEAVTAAKKEMEQLQADLDAALEADDLQAAGEIDRELDKAQRRIDKAAAVTKTAPAPKKPAAELTRKEAKARMVKAEEEAEAVKETFLAVPERGATPQAQALRKLFDNARARVEAYRARAGGRNLNPLDDILGAGEPKQSIDELEAEAERLRAATKAPAPAPVPAPAPAPVPAAADIPAPARALAATEVVPVTEAAPTPPAAPKITQRPRTIKGTPFLDPSEPRVQPQMSPAQEAMRAFDDWRDAIRTFGEDSEEAAAAFARQQELFDAASAKERAAKAAAAAPTAEAPVPTTPTAALPAAPTPITEVVEAPAEAAKIVEAPAPVVEAPPVEAPKLVSPDLIAARRKFEVAKAELDALGPQPKMPRNEKQAFGSAGKEAARKTDPAAVARWEAQVKAARAWPAKSAAIRARLDEAVASLRGRDPIWERAHEGLRYSDNLADLETDVVLATDAARPAAQAKLDEARQAVEQYRREMAAPAVRVTDAEIEKAPEVKKAMKARQVAANKLKIAQGKAAEATGKQATKATEALRAAEKADEEAEIAYQAVRNQTEARLTAAAEKQPGLFPSPVPEEEEPRVFRSIGPTVPQTETPAFKAWFGDSRVVDENGKPLVVYHGTSTEVSSFQRGLRFKDTLNDIGFWFSTDPSDASMFARAEDGGQVVPAYVKSTRPLYIDTVEDLRRLWAESGAGRDFRAGADKFRAWAQAQGFDSVVFDGASVDPSFARGQYIVVFEPTQIKSAVGNVGTFDPNEPSILRSIERDARRVDAERAARKRLADIMIADAVGMNIAQEYEQIPEAFRVAAGRRLRKAAEGLEAGKITEQDYKKLVAAVTSDLEDQAELRRARATRGPVRGADWVRSRLLAAKSQGALDEAGVDLADWFIRQNPAIAEDLAVSIRKGGEGATAGFYDRMGKLVTLLKGKGTELTATHEVLHHTERMLPAALQDGIRKEWRKRLVAALKTATPQQRPFLEKMLTGADAEGVVKAFENGALPNAFYQYANPSEFWAVNASEIVAGRYAAFNAGFVAKAKRWLTEFVQKAKSVFGLQSDAPLIRGLDAVLKGDGTFVSKQMLTDRGIFKSIGQAPPPAMPTNVIRLTNPSGEVKGIVETMEDGRNIIKLFRGADPSVVIRGVGVVLRRTALSNSDMVKVTSWLRGLGIQVSHQYGEFTGSPAEVQRAEEAFGKSLEQYVIEGQTANPTLLPVLDHLKNTLLNTYRAVSDPVIGVPLDANVRQVFDAALADTAEQPMSSVKDLLRKQLLGLEQDDIGFLETLSKEAQRKGIPSTTVEELRAAFDAAVKGGAKAEDTHLSFPVPVLGKKDWSLDDLARAQAKAEMGRVVEKARAKGLQINLKAAKKGTAGLPEEETAVETLRSALQNRDADLPITKDAKKALRLVTATFFGGDVIGENAARYFPPEMRRALDTAARIVEQSIGDTVSLVNDAIHAKKDKELIRYLAGGSDIRRLAGRPIVSAGHDYMGSVLDVWRRVAANLEPEERAALREFAEILDTAPSYSEYTRRLATFGFRPEDVEGESLARRIKSFRRAEKAEEARGQALVSAIDKFLFLKGGEDADFGQALGQALRAAIGTPKNIPQIPSEMRLMETIAYLSGVSARKVGDADPAVFTGTSAEAARVLLGAEGVKHSIGDLFGEEALRRVAVIIGGYGSADLAKTHLVGMDLGLSTEAYKAFENWSQGRAWDPKYSEDIQRIVDRYGYNPDFINDATLDVDFYIPRAARERLSMALVRATYRPSDIAGPGAMVNTLYRYMKQRMTRGSFFLRPRYYMMNTVDHFMQTAMTSGVGVAAASVTRVIAQDIMVLPFWQQVVDAVTRVPGVKRLPVVGKYATPDALERFRAGLQKLGDRGAQNIATLFGVSKYRIEVNPILEGLDGGFRVGDKFYSYRAVRDVAVQEGVFASFDTRQLANAIEREGALVIRQQVDGLSDFVSASEKGTVISGGGKIRDFFAGWQETVRDTAEAWGERERLGAMVTLMEAGYDPRTAARLTIDALYDYSQSMTKADRSLLVGIMFPFWAFQKNANAQIFNLMFSPWGAYRMMCLERARERGADLLAEILYNDVGSEYDLDVKSMPPELQDTYYSIITAFEQAYDGTPPLEAKRALRMLFANRARDVEEGKLVQLTPDMLRLRDSRALSEITRKFAPYIQMRPSKSERMTYLRDREGIPVPFPRTTAVQWYNKLLGDQHSYLEYYLPESTIETGMRHMTQITAAYMLLGSMPIDWMLRSGQSLGLYSGPTLTERGTEEVKLTRQIGAFFDPARSPFIGPILADISSDYVPAKKVALKLGQGVAAATKVHPMIGKIMDDMFGTTFLRVEAKNDPFVIAAADGDFSRLSPEMVAEIKALQAEYPDVGKLRDQRYYINGGVWSTLFENSPLGELNAQLLNWEESPAERADIRGKILAWARAVIGADVAEVSATKTMKAEEPTKMKETKGI